MPVLQSIYITKHVNTSFPFGMVFHTANLQTKAFRSQRRSTLHLLDFQLQATNVLNFRPLFVIIALSRIGQFGK